MRAACIALAAAWTWAGPAGAGPWAPARRTAVVRCGVSAASATRLFCGGGRADCSPGDAIPFDAALGGSWGQQMLSASADASVSSKLSLGGTANVVRVRYEDRVGTSTSSGLGDMTMCAQYAVTTWPVASAVALRVKAPAAREPSPARFLRLGDGQWDIDALASIGRSFWPVPAYAFVESGYRRRTTSHRFTPSIDVGDEIPFHAEAGVTIARRYGARARIAGFLGRGDRSESARFPARSLVRAEPSLALALGRGAEIELTASFTLAGRGLPDTQAIRLSYGSAPLHW